MYDTLKVHCIYLPIDKSSIIKDQFLYRYVTITGNIDERHKNKIQRVIELLNY